MLAVVVVGQTWKRKQTHNEYEHMDESMIMHEACMHNKTNRLEPDDN